MIYSAAFLFAQDAPPEKHNGFSFTRQSCWHQWKRGIKSINMKWI